VSAFEPELPIEEQGKVACTIKVSGKPVIS
jgi:hypothetical protein